MATIGSNGVRSFGYRGPQSQAQNDLQSRTTTANGNPGGANNTSFVRPDMGGYYGGNGGMSDYAIRNGGQRPDLARYVAPQLDANGNPVRRDQGGYAYNLPNAAGPYPEFANFGLAPNMQSAFQSLIQRQSVGAQPAVDQDAYYQDMMNRAHGNSPPAVGTRGVGDPRRVGSNRMPNIDKPGVPLNPGKPGPENSLMPRTKPLYLTPPDTNPGSIDANGLVGGIVGGNEQPPIPSQQFVRPRLNRFTGNY